MATYLFFGLVILFFGCIGTFAAADKRARRICAVAVLCSPVWPLWLTWWIGYGAVHMFRIAIGKDD